MGSDAGKDVAERALNIDSDGSSATGSKRQAGMNAQAAEDPLRR